MRSAVLTMVALVALAALGVACSSAGGVPGAGQKSDGGVATDARLDGKLPRVVAELAGVRAKLPRIVAKVTGVVPSLSSTSPTRSGPSAGPFLSSAVINAPPVVFRPSTVAIAGVSAWAEAPR